MSPAKSAGPTPNGRWPASEHFGLDYLAIEVITMYETNVKQHFVEYVERFVNVSWEKKALIAIIKKPG